MEAPDARLDLERRLQHLRWGSKAVCICVSLLLLGATWLSFYLVAIMDVFYREMGAIELPLIVRWAFILLKLQVPVQILSLGFFLGILFCCLRHRNGAFLWMTAVHLIVGALSVATLLIGAAVAMIGLSSPISLIHP